MNERVRWVTKAEAAEELEVSLSTLDRKIRTGEVEIRREGRRVYVRMVGEYITDEELLRLAIIREDDLEQTVRELEQSASDWEQERAGLERERDAARDEVARWETGYDEYQEERRKERAAHERTRRLAIRLGVAVAMLLVVVGLLTWRLFA